MKAAETLGFFESETVEREAVGHVSGSPCGRTLARKRIKMQPGITRLMTHRALAQAVVCTRCRLITCGVEGGPKGSVVRRFKRSCATRSFDWQRGGLSFGLVPTEEARTTLNIKMDSLGRGPG
ncbi:hypothetical protein HAX54_026615 [Datura stramonium]|uniref:Uncharacterized protein n=1 Tax=Datura stramonium TaxID=4076 RepID=A0ABS8S805_DATST|nr:hypothetical protein [Datura stramonium]